MGKISTEVGKITHVYQYRQGGRDMGKLEDIRNNPNKTFLYHRTLLSDEGKKIYDDLRYGLLSFSNTINTHSISRDTALLKQIYSYVINDNPCIFSRSIGIVLNPLTGSVKFTPSYTVDLSQANQIVENSYISMHRILNRSTASNEFDQLKFLHDRFCANLTYDHTFQSSAYEFYGPFLYKTAVCSGISKAFKAMCDISGIHCIYVTGTSSADSPSIAGMTGIGSDGHAWNIVYIDGQYGHVDVTFDLGLTHNKSPAYDYFLLNDNIMSRDHEWNKTITPRCTQSISYLDRIGGRINNSTELIAYIRKMIKQGEKNISFRSDHTWDSSTIMECLNIAQATSSLKSLLKTINTGMSYSVNDKIGVYHIHL